MKLDKSQRVSDSTSLQYLGSARQKTAWWLLGAGEFGDVNPGYTCFAKETLWSEPHVSLGLDLDSPKEHSVPFHLAEP